MPYSSHSENLDLQIHPSAEVSEKSKINSGTAIWAFAQVREGAAIGHDCILGTGTYVDRNVVIGNSVKIQNGAQLFEGANIEDNVFIGPGAIITNDRFPRSANPDGTIKTADDWTLQTTTVKRGASIGARAVLLGGITVGRFAMIGAGAVVIRDVPDNALVVGNPSKVIGIVGICGHPQADESVTVCDTCGISDPLTDSSRNPASD
jgi:UDP-2-acetamido-3-amino-2,3-dideoxy-glucuronate N-acetyltransferase